MGNLRADVDTSRVATVEDFHRRRSLYRLASDHGTSARCPVRICENPVVVAAAADELGARCQPLVCVGGQPSAAGWRLLELLAAGGAEFGHHGDFDWGGVRIGVRSTTG
jgi:uncharacterized protein (TIGR02679 family)